MVTFCSSHSIVTFCFSSQASPTPWWHSAFTHKLSHSMVTFCFCSQTLLLHGTLLFLLTNSSHSMVVTFCIYSQTLPLHGNLLLLLTNSSNSTVTFCFSSQTSPTPWWYSAFPHKLLPLLGESSAFPHKLLPLLGESSAFPHKLLPLPGESQLFLTNYSTPWWIFFFCSQTLPLLGESSAFAHTFSSHSFVIFCFSSQTSPTPWWSSAFPHKLLPLLGVTTARSVLMIFCFLHYLLPFLGDLLLFLTSSSHSLVIFCFSLQAPPTPWWSSAFPYKLLSLFRHLLLFFTNSSFVLPSHSLLVIFCFSTPSLLPSQNCS